MPPTGDPTDEPPSNGRELPPSLSTDPPHHRMSPSQYLSTRLSSLIIPPDLSKQQRLPNPIRLLRTLTRKQWAFFLVAFSAWTWDAFDFFTVSLTVADLSRTFGKTKTDITWGITLVLMFRSLGAALFGWWGDTYGRKWPFVVNNLLFVALELVSYLFLVEQGCLT